MTTLDARADMPDNSPLLALLQRSDPTRREGNGERKVSARGLRTRAGLMAAARELFTLHGYQSTSVAQICATAGTSLGTFYQYFAERSDVLSALVAHEVEVLLADESRTWHVEDGPDGVERFLLAYIRSTADNAAFWRVWEEVTHTDATLASVRADLTRLLNKTVARQILRGQSRGLVSNDLDPIATACALTAMVDRYVYVTYVFDPDPVPPPYAATAELLGFIWSRTVFDAIT